MDTRKESARRKLVKESDLDSSIRLLDAVRDSPTCRTPPVPAPAAPTTLDDDDTNAAREKYEEAKDIVNGIYGYCPKTPTAATRKAQLWESLGPVFYATVKAKYPRPQDLHAFAGGTPGTAAAVGVPGDEKADRDDILEKLLTRLDKIGAFIKTQRMVGAPAVLPKRNCKGLDGFRVGVGHDPRVGFDPAGAKRAYCPSSTAAYCQPVAECTAEVLHTLALCQVSQTAADNGMEAFAAVVDGAAWCTCGGESGGDGRGRGRLCLRLRGREDGRAGGAAAASQPMKSACRHTDPQQQVMPRHGGASAAVGGVPAGYAAHVRVPTEDSGPVNHFGEAHSRNWWWAAVLRPSAFGQILSCWHVFIGSLVFGIAGVTAGLSDAIRMDNGNSVTEDPVMCIGATCLYSGVDSLSPEIRQQVLQLFATAGTVTVAAAVASPGGDWISEHGGVSGTPQPYIWQIVLLYNGVAQWKWVPNATPEPLTVYYGNREGAEYCWQNIIGVPSGALRRWERKRGGGWFLEDATRAKEPVAPLSLPISNTRWKYSTETDEYRGISYTGPKKSTPTNSDDSGAGAVAWSKEKLPDSDDDPYILGKPEDASSERLLNVF
ncbi:hypothetical protein CYMTET_5453 [Cymbomonas tetramitiformis]|uniref:Uncharacterized protein n=1 Tax=Cymbomonas tetramitiformis TaxID=36881 RepID=A0AAE0LJC9_9CHLO|nr:hypothetical protein CYMTET_5453 [Cymbomonas tetramitiformis]